MDSDKHHCLYPHTTTQRKLTPMESAFFNRGHRSIWSLDNYWQFSKPAPQWRVPCRLQAPESRKCMAAMVSLKPDACLSLFQRAKGLCSAITKIIPKTGERGKVSVLFGSWWWLRTLKKTKPWNPLQHGQYADNIRSHKKPLSMFITNKVFIISILSTQSDRFFANCKFI